MRTERFPELQNQDDKLKADRRICAKLGFYNLLAGLPEGPRGNIAFYLIAYRFIGVRSNFGLQNSVKEKSTRGK